MEIELPIIKIRDVLVVRGQKVATAAAAAAFYGIVPAVLMRTVNRNKKKFTKELMFYLTLREIVSLPGNSRKFNKNHPVFTEIGVSMLSTVLQSPKAVQTNIEIVRQTVRLLRLGNY
jgi:hypothetical protein